jgi:hypothetical protein
VPICQNPEIRVSYYLFAPQGSGEAEELHPPQAENHLHSICSLGRVADVFLFGVGLPVRSCGRFDSGFGVDKLVKLPRRGERGGADLVLILTACRFDSLDGEDKIEKLPFGPGCDDWVGGASDP